MADFKFYDITEDEFMVKVAACCGRSRNKRTLVKARRFNTPLKAIRYVLNMTVEQVFNYEVAASHSDGVKYDTLEVWIEKTTYVLTPSRRFVASVKQIAETEWRGLHSLGFTAREWKYKELVEEARNYA